MDEAIPHQSAGSAAHPAPRSPFEHYRDEDVRLLVDRFPLAWVIASDGFTASQLPLIGRYSDGGELTGLVGHFALGNPLNAALQANPVATVLFNGPQGYVSPSLAGSRQWGPTWNYAHLRLRVEVTVDQAFTPQALELLIAHVERHLDRPWQASELGSRFDRMIGRIIGFDARILDARARFKLGQDESPGVLDSILASHDNLELVEWMRLFNPREDEPMGSNATA